LPPSTPTTDTDHRQGADPLTSGHSMAGCARDPAIEWTVARFAAAACTRRPAAPHRLHHLLQRPPLIPDQPPHPPKPSLTPAFIAAAVASVQVVIPAAAANRFQRQAGGAHRPGRQHPPPCTHTAMIQATRAPTGSGGTARPEPGLGPGLTGPGQPEADRSAQNDAWLARPGWPGWPVAEEAVHD
jgi:hypothetical protein